MKLRGVILQASYRVVPQPDGRRVPVIHIYGRLPDGGTFLVREHRQRPHFYVRADEAERARALGAPHPRVSDKRTFAGAPVSRLEVETPPDVPPLRDRLQAAGIETFEADVRFAVRYLIERGIKGACEIEGEARPGTGTTWVFDDPLLRRPSSRSSRGCCRSTSKPTRGASGCSRFRCTRRASTRF